MDHLTPVTDEHTLAAFFAGTLSHQRRDAVMAHLADDEDALELALMAREALEAAFPAPQRVAQHVPMPRRHNRAA